MDRYIEHIISDLVRDTRIDYDQDRIYYPPLPHQPTHPLLLSFQPHTPNPPYVLLSFSNYCKERYGLTENEINYVWDQYTSIIKDKITKREP